jgi:hypothetical protein
MSSPTTDLTEASMAQHYGLPRRQMAGLRSRYLTEGVDFTRDGNHIVISAAGQKKIAEKLEPPMAAAEKNFAGPVDGAEVPPAPPQPAAAPEVLEFIICRIPMNPRYVIARNAAGRNNFRIRVGNNRNFKLGMNIRGEQIDALDDGHFRMVGRQPRWPGRW